MDRKTLIQEFEDLKVWKKGDAREPHKPLLVFYAVGALLKGKSRLLPYSEIDENLENLLRKLNTSGSPRGTNYPFWRLRNDGVWEVAGAEGIYAVDVQQPTKSDFLPRNAHGGFTEDVYCLLETQTDLAFEIAQMMLDIHFAAERHLKILFWTWVDCTGPGGKRLSDNLFVRKRKTIQRRPGT